MFTPIVSYTDLYSRLYSEVIGEITREETALMDRAITAGLQEVKGYLIKFDLTALFGDGTNNATVTDIWLNNICVDICAWNLIKLGNPSVKFEAVRLTYESACATLKKIQQGYIMPVDSSNNPWPYRNTIGETAPQGDSVYVRSNYKRRNSY